MRRKITLFLSVFLTLATLPVASPAYSFSYLPIKIPTIIGYPAVSQTVSVDTGSWDGQPTSFTYQWKRCEGSPPTNFSCWRIDGATNKSLTLSDIDGGRYLQVDVTAFFAGRTAGSSISSPYSVRVRTVSDGITPNSAATITGMYDNRLEQVYPILFNVTSMSKYLPCKQTQSMGLTVENIETGRTVSGFPMIETLGAAEDRKNFIGKTFTVTPGDWDAGQYKIRPVVIDTCKNENTAAQANEIIVKVPEMVQFKVNESSAVVETSANRDLSLAAVYHPLINVNRRLAEKPEWISFISNSLSPAIFSCANFSSKNKMEVSRNPNLSTNPNCSYKIQESLNGYDWKIDTKGLPEGTHDLQILIYNSAGKQYKASTSIWIPKATKTSIAFVSQFSDLVSGLTEFDVSALIDPKSSATVKEVSIQLVGSGLNPNFKDSQGNSFLSPRFIGTLNATPGLNTWTVSSGKSFRFTLDTSSWANGNFSIIAATLDSTGTYSRVEKSFLVQNSGPIINNSSIQLPNGDVSESLRLGFSATNQSNSSSKIQIVKVLKDGISTTDGLIAEFPNQGVRNGGWVVDGITKFSWRLSFAETNDIIYDMQNGFWSVPIAEDPETESRIKTNVSFSIVDNYGRVSTANSIAPALITCVACETKIIKELKNIRSVNKSKKLSDSSIELIKASLSESLKIKQTIRNRINSGESTKSDVNKEFAEFSTGRTLPFTWQKRPYKLVISEQFWEQNCTNAELRIKGKESIDSATSSKNLSFDNFESLNNQLSEIDKIISDIQAHLDEAKAKASGLDSISKSDKVTDSQVSDARKIQENVSDISAKSKGRVEDAKRVESNSQTYFSKIDQVRPIIEVKDQFFKSAESCLGKNERLFTNSGPIKGDLSAKKNGKLVTIICVNKKTGKEPEKVSGKAPKCSNGKIERKF